MNSDRAAGVVLMAAGLATLIGASQHELGTLHHFGPGMFPVAIAGVLTVLGAVVIFRGRQIERQAGNTPSSSPYRAIAILGAIAAFAVLIERAGLLVTSPIVVGIASLANRTQSAREVAILAALLTCVLAAIFVGALGMPLLLLPAGLAGW
jgi:heme/copper-type cytochrome/quinol oxidase subunit 3